MSSASLALPVRSLGEHVDNRFWPITACHEGLQSTQSCGSLQAEIGGLLPAR
jgi:hypothetical protein